MPFKSEKQRRYLWATHPEIAKEWAHNYPDSNKNLPMYANDHTDKSDKTDETPDSEKKEKRTKVSYTMLSACPFDVSQIVGKIGAYVKNCNYTKSDSFSPMHLFQSKFADSKQERVDIPHSEEPTYAGEEREKGEIKNTVPLAKNVSGDEDGGGKRNPENAINSLLQKLSVVLSPHIEQTIENMNAEAEGRVPTRIGRNRGIKRYPVATPSIPLPLGMQQPQAPQQAQTPNGQPHNHHANNAGNNRAQPVGGGSHPQFNPINSFGAISSTGVINGNAAFGAKNSPDSSKIGSWLRAKLANDPAVTPAAQQPEGPTIPDWIKPEYHEGMRGDPGQRKYMYFPHAENLPQAGGRLVETETGRILQSQIPDRDAYFKYMEEGGAEPSKALVFPSLPQQQQPPQAQKPAQPAQQPAQPAAQNKSWFGGFFGGNKPATPAPATPKPAPTPTAPKPPVNTGATNAMKSLTPTPIPKIAEIIKRASKSEALAKLMGLDYVDPVDVDYYNEEYEEELAGRAMQKAASEDALEHDLPAEEKPVQPPSLLTTGLVGAGAGLGAFGLGKYLESKGYAPSQLIQPYLPPAPEWLKNLGTKLEAYMTPKTAQAIEKWAKKDTPCSCGCGDTVQTCKCSAACSCRKAGGSCYKAEMAKSAGKTPAWQRSAGKNEEGGLNEKGRKSYEREHGGNLKAPVTQKNPKGEAKKRQNSFCSRMCGMKRVNTGAKTKNDPDSRINKSLRKWNCKCSSAMEFGLKLAAAPFALGPSNNPKDVRNMLAGAIGPQQTQAYQQRVQRGTTAMNQLMGRGQTTQTPAAGGGAPTVRSALLGGIRGGFGQSLFPGPK